MCEITIEVAWPHCRESKVVKNGHKKDGRQNFLYRCCGKQFVYSYLNKGADPKIKHLISRMLLRNCGIRDIAQVLQLSPNSVFRHLIHQGDLCRIIPKKKHYHSVQIDQHWSYVKHKKKGKRWLIYAYVPQTDEVLGYVIGQRDIKIVKRLYKLLKEIKIDEFCSDHWKAFAHLLAKENHQIGKHFTRHIEGVTH